jgi:hypothetical protein
LGVGRGDYNATKKKFTVKKAPEPMVADHGGGKEAQRAVAPIKKT